MSRNQKLYRSGSSRKKSASSNDPEIIEVEGGYVLIAETYEQEREFLKKHGITMPDKREW
jgi:hypothetical protein